MKPKFLDSAKMLQAFESLVLAGQRLRVFLSVTCVALPLLFFITSAYFSSQFRAAARPCSIVTIDGRCVSVHSENGGRVVATSLDTGAQFVLQRTDGKSYPCRCIYHIEASSYGTSCKKASKAERDLYKKCMTQDSAWLQSDKSSQPKIARH